MCVRHVPVFSALDEAGFLAVHKLVRHRDVGKQTLLFQEGEPFTDLIIVRGGHLVLVKHGPDDEEVVTERIGVGGVYGSEKLFTDQQVPLHDVSGIAEIPSAFCLIRLDHFRDLVANDERIALTLLSELNARLAECHRRLYAAGIKDAVKRIAYYLAGEPGISEGKLIEKSQEAIGQALFLTKETVNRKLKQMEDEGILSIEGKKKIRIRNYKHLMAIAHGSAN